MKAPVWPVWLLMLLAVAAEMVPVASYVEPFRPPFATMAVIYWALMWPGRFGVFSAWLLGLLLDVSGGTILGQHALSLSVVSFLVLRFHLQLRVFPLWQLAASVFALLFLDAFLRLWVDGVIGKATLGPARWGPVLAAGLLWPLLMALMDRVRERLERRDTGLS